MKMEKLRNPENPEVCHMFWHGNFTLMEKAAVSSFVKHGFKVNLWSYQGLEVDGAISRNAEEILPESDLHKYSQYHPIHKIHNTLTAFADLFRIVVLTKEEGWWFDTDCFCLVNQSKFYNLRSTLGENRFLTGKHLLINEPNKSCANVAAMWMTADEASILKETLLELFKKYNNKLPIWGMSSPRLIQSHVDNYKLYKNTVDEKYFYEIHWTEPDLYSDPAKLSTALRRIKNSYLTHVWNSSAEKADYVKDGSLMDYLINGKL